MSIASQRKISASSRSIDDYPEHLNPFFEDDNHNKIRFWTIGRKSFRERSSSLSVGLRDLRSTWSFKSFMKKGRRDSVTPSPPKATSTPSGSPIIYRKAESSQNGFNRKALSATPDRYVYGGSITPLPRSRFQERISHLDQRSPNDENSGNLSEVKDSTINGSRLSVQSNAFGESPIRASTRKKRRAPPPPARSPLTTISATETNFTTESKNEIANKSANDSGIDERQKDFDVDDPSFTVELKIIEDDDVAKNINEQEESTTKYERKTKIKVNGVIPSPPGDPPEEGNDLFRKVNICSYKRQDSIVQAKSVESLDEEVPAIPQNENIEKKDCPVTAKEDSARNEGKIAAVDHVMKDFLDIDKATHELEIEIRKLNEEMETMYDNEKEPSKRKTVSEMKQLFDGAPADASIPNPIPKPRRSRLSNSSNESNQLSPSHKEDSKK